MAPPRRPDPAVWETPVMRKALAAHDFAVVFWSLIYDYGYTQSEVGTMVGLHQPNISDYVNGKRLVSQIFPLRRIVEGLDIPPGYVGLACCPCPHYDGDRPGGT